MNTLTKFDSLLSTCVEKSGSDVHLTCNEPVVMRFNGELARLDESFNTEQIDELLRLLMNEQQYQNYCQDFTIDLGYSSSHGYRFRINCYREQGRNAIAVRYLNQDVLTLEKLNLPRQIRQLSELKSGLVLVTGATGSGKSTTLAALIQEINENRACHILTVEDPLEFVHVSRKSMVHHRELYTDVPDFASAIRAALREDPDVIMVGEMRDLDTMRAALTAAETGHLVFSTLHTSDAVGVVERFVGNFPGVEQDVARYRLAASLCAVVAQNLLPMTNGKGRIPAVEILLGNSAVANLIATGKSRQLYSTIESSTAEGMQTLDQSLVDLILRKLISETTAFRYCTDRKTLERLLQMKKGIQ